MNRRRMLSLSLGVLLASLASTACSKNTPDVKSFTVDEVASRIAAKDGKTFLFDANGKERFAKGHLPGARWVQYDGVTAADLPADKSATLVFYCANEL